MCPKKMKIIYLLGAGFSVPAGLDDINKVTLSFLYNHVERSENDDNSIKLLWETTCAHFKNRKDIESFLTLVQMLEDDEMYELLLSKYEKIKKIQKKELQEIKLNAQKHIRNQLEKKINIKFLENLNGFDYPINIFTLNYDSVRDVFCEINDIEFTDGFDPFWNSQLFQETEFQINLFRLHGSLYWLKTPSGKILKVPIFV